MIIGIGVDTVLISRMKDSLANKNFKESVFTINEINNVHGKEEEYYATRFACKEAVFKAIGKPLDYRLIETLNDDSGKPIVTKLDEFKDYKIHISITTEGGFATAFCIVEAL